MSKLDLTPEQKAALLQRQFDTAMAGSEALLIHLGKAALGQHDRVKHEVDHRPQLVQEYDRETLEQMLLERQKAIPDELLTDALKQLTLEVASART